MNGYPACSETQVCLPACMVHTSVAEQRRAHAHTSSCAQAQRCRPSTMAISGLAVHRGGHEHRYAIYSSDSLSYSSLGLLPFPAVSAHCVRLVDS
ncbi:hypothetical protein K439DRAFT_444510 [Ramaria rubella]|nr:hypothetical protein K439DRAFT_444510 [Ramaria rubella]